jgi:putative transposase
VTRVRRREVTHRCVYRVVWCTKFSRPLLEGLEEELRALLVAAAGSVDAAIEEGDITSSRVSILVRVDPTIGPHRTVRHMKGRSSAALRSKYPALRSRVPTLWNSRYFVASVGKEPHASELDVFVSHQARA